jgi:hypothetical protein
MPKSCTIRSGDTLTKIARLHGVPSWRDIYHAPDNAAFRAKRPNPDRIFPGDVVIIPDPWGQVGPEPGSPPPRPPPALPNVCVCRHFGGAPVPQGDPGLTPVARFAPPTGSSRFQAVAVAAPAPPGPPPPSPLAAALGVAGTALGWVNVAILELQEIARLMRDGADPASRAEGWRGLQNCFRVGNLPDNAARLARTEELLRRFDLVKRSVSQPHTFFVEDLARTHAYAEAPMGGVLAGQKITFFRPYVLPFDGPFVALQSGPMFRITVMIHEAAHFAKAGLGHVADPTPPPFGNHVPAHNPFPGHPNWVTMTADMALENAYSYAQFCLHLEKGGDFRLQNFAL